MSIQDNVSTATFILNILTWKRLFKVSLVLIFFALIVLTLMSVTIFHIPTPIEKEDENIKLLNISYSAKEKLETTIKRIPEVIGIQIVTLNFKRNIRIDTYDNIRIPTVKSIYDKWTTDKLFETPLFTADKINNKQMLHLINGEFMCMSYKDTILYRYMPQLDQVFITDVCEVGIPPYSGDSSGLLTFYMNQTPSADQKRILFLIARDISTTIADDNK